MSWWDKSFVAVYFLMMIIVQCAWQNSLIKRYRPINHLYHGVVYSITAFPMLYFFSPFQIQVIVLAVLIRVALFDPILNGFRRLPFYYNGAGASWIDRMENRLSSFWLMLLKIFYIILFVTVFILIK